MADQQQITSYLFYQSGDGPAQTVIWDTISITVGRLESQDIVVQDPEVSREHAVFRRKDDRCTVEDLGTALGTLVNGTESTAHELQQGDVVRIGPLDIEFGQTRLPIGRGPNSRFASELKGFCAPAGAGADGGGTMLAFSAEEDPFPTMPPAAAPAARAVSATGEVEEVDELAPLGGADLDAYLGDPLQAPSFDLQPPVNPVTETETTVKLVLELEGPSPQLQAIVSALLDKRIEVPPVKIRLRKPGPL